MTAEARRTALPAAGEQALGELICLDLYRGRAAGHLARDRMGRAVAAGRLELEPARFRAGCERLNGDLAEVAADSRAGDRGEPLGGDAVGVDPAPNVLGWNPKIGCELSRAPFGDQGSEPHDSRISRFVSYDKARQHDVSLRRGYTHCMEALTPGERLRKARRAAKLSRSELADRVGLSVSAVGAHENGQNGIRKEAAVLYARELGRTPEWLLFAQEDAATGPGSGRIFAPIPAQFVPVVGRISASVWERTTDPQEEPRRVAVAGASTAEMFKSKLCAVEIGAAARGLEAALGGHLIVERNFAAAADGDMLVTQQVEGAFRLTGLFRIGLSTTGMSASDMLQGEERWETAGIEESALKVGDRPHSVLGLVVGLQWKRPTT